MRRILMVCVVLAFLGGAAWFLSRPSEEAIIERLLLDAARQASFDVNEHPLARLGAAKSLADLCVEGTRVILVSENEEREFVFSVNEIRDKIVALRTSLAQLAVSLKNVEVQVNGDSARVTARGAAIGRDHGRDDYFLERHPLEILLERTESGWKLTSARNLDTLMLE